MNSTNEQTILIEDQIDKIESCSEYSVVEARYAMAVALRYLRDEIQNLKTETLRKELAESQKRLLAEPVDEVSKLKVMVMDAAKQCDAMVAYWKERAEKAELIIKQLHHLAKQLPEDSK